MKESGERSQESGGRTGEVNIHRYIPGSIHQADNQRVLINCSIETMTAGYVYGIIKCDDLYIKERGCFSPLLVSGSLKDHMKWMMDFIKKLPDVRDFSITLYIPSVDESGIIARVWSDWQKENRDE